MLTTSQVTIVGATTNDGYLCRKCLEKHIAGDIGCREDDVTYPIMEYWLSVAKNQDDGYHTLIEYNLEEETANDGIYCDSCGAEMKAPQCAECGEEFDDENTTRQGQDKYGQRVCDSCLVNLAEEYEKEWCTACECWVPKENMEGDYLDVDGNLICDDCWAEQQSKHCAVCGAELNGTNAIRNYHTTTGENLCDECGRN